MVFAKSGFPSLTSKGKDSASLREIRYPAIKNIDFIISMRCRIHNSKLFKETKKNELIQSKRHNHMHSCS